MRRADDFHKHAPTKIEQDIALERANLRVHPRQILHHTSIYTLL